MKNLVIFLFFMSVILLVGCKKQEDVAYYFQHPKVLSKKLRSCQQISGSSESDQKACQTAFIAATRIQGLSEQFVRSQQGFGQKILKIQVALAKLHEEIKRTQADKEQLEFTKLQTESQLKQMQLDEYRAIVAMFVQP